MDYCHYDDNDEAESSIILKSLGGEVLEAVDGDRGGYEVDEVTHRWQESAFERLAAMKQTILNKAAREGYAFVFLCDSDLILDPYTLYSLLSSQQEITNAVFWTRWTPDAPPQPQCWLTHPYGLAGRGMSQSTFLKRLVDRQLVQVAGGGACTLIAATALRKGVGYHPRLPGLPQGGMWRGEDRSFALRAERLHVAQWADAWPNIFHAYHPDQRSEEVLDAVYETLAATSQEKVAYGDLIHFCLYPLDNDQQRQSIPQHLRSIRGRLGSIQMLPELEAALIGMKRGGERSLRLTFPPWWPIEPMQGQSIHVLVELIDHRSYGFAPIVGDVAFKELLG